MQNLTLTILACCCLSASALKRKLTLLECMHSNKIEAAFQSNGTHKGLCILANFKNISKDSLIITIEAGSILRSASEQEQDILIVKSEQVLLPAKTTSSLSLKGYCCQASHLSPAVKRIYTPVFHNDSNLFRLARYLDQRGFADETGQNAVWVVSDQRSIANIADTSESLMSLRQTLASITAIELPWYHIRLRSLTLRDRSIVHLPQRLSGTLFYDSHAEDYATCIITDAEGRIVGKIESGWVRAGTKIPYELDLDTRSLTAGTYKVTLTTSTRALVTKTFNL